MDILPISIAFQKDYAAHVSQLDVFNIMLDADSKVSYDRYLDYFHKHTLFDYMKTIGATYRIINGVEMNKNELFKFLQRVMGVADILTADLFAYIFMFLVSKNAEFETSDYLLQETSLCFATWYMSPYVGKMCHRICRANDRLAHWDSCLYRREGLFGSHPKNHSDKELRHVLAVNNLDEYFIEKKNLIMVYITNDDDGYGDKDIRAYHNYINWIGAHGYANTRLRDGDAAAEMELIMEVVDNHDLKKDNIFTYSPIFGSRVLFKAPDEDVPRLIKSRKYKPVFAEEVRARADNIEAQRVLDGLIQNTINRR